MTYDIFCDICLFRERTVKQMNTIQDLYYGRISPYEMSISTTPEYQTVSKTHRIRDRHILDLRTGYVHRRIPAWREANDRRHEGRITAPIAQRKPM